MTHPIVCRMLRRAGSRTGHFCIAGDETQGLPLGKHLADRAGLMRKYPARFASSAPDYFRSRGNSRPVVRVHRRDFGSLPSSALRSSRPQQIEHMGLRPSVDRTSAPNAMTRIYEGVSDERHLDLGVVFP